MASCIGSRSKYIRLSIYHILKIGRTVRYGEYETFDFDIIADIS